MCGLWNDGIAGRAVPGRLILALIGACVIAGQAGRVGAGEFDRLEGEELEALARVDATSRPGLTVAELDALPRLVRDESGGLLVVRTDQGSLSRLLASPGLRRPPGQAEGGVPVVVIERLATFEPGRSGSRVAKGERVILFDGFHLDLDAGVVVPAGQGGDLVFEAKAEGGPRLSVVAPARLFRPESLPRPQAKADAPSPGRAIVPTDFTGRYQLQADGRWSGLLELNVGDEKRVTGRFRSEPGGTSYPVRGAIEPASANAITFTIQFPRSEQEYVGRLWSEGKWGLAGTFTMLGRTLGFFAIREGAKWADRD